MKSLLAFFIGISSCCYGQAPKPACTETYFRYVVGALADDSMKGRLPGTAEEKKAAVFINNEFRRAGCRPVHRKSFYPFDYRSPDSVSIIHSAGNVVAVIDIKSDYAIVISAHYDHLGMGKYHSKTPFSSGVYNGADDNASGVAMMLGMASWCKAHRKALKFDVIFVAFSGEEDGLYGSKEFVAHCPVDTAKILCCLNFDMVGRLDLLRPMLRVDAALDFAAWDSVFPGDSAKGFNVQRRHNQLADGSDHCSFIVQHIPALLFITGVHSDYHTPADDVSKINFEGMVLLSAYFEELLFNMNRRKDVVQLFSRQAVQQ